jgi:hypothetical protein
VTCKLVFEIGNLEVAVLQLSRQKCHHTLKFDRVIGQRFKVVQHGILSTRNTLAMESQFGKKILVFVEINVCLIPPVHPAFSGRQVRCGMRQSMPSSSIANCAAVRLTLPSRADGQTNLPRSSRLENRHAP